ncbi:hypothetical protein PISL3812_07843 [Talaromyces islandicus]|uniref:Alcohol acetyltransferase FCK4 n=1 Tax=Talaromyces islandicus TaxID=28573 RepID=A0A0U1M5A7_TALIS|nr:hypothetical protein PISL3812_07843 [Talaromyces islandicus]
MANPTVEGLQKIRDLGRLEKHSAAQHSLGFHTNIAINASYSHSKPLKSLKTVIFQAVKEVIQQHAILGVIPVNEDKPDPYFGRLSQFDLRDVVRFVTREQTRDTTSGSDPELDAVLEHEHNINFKQRYGELPFWRLVILQDLPLDQISPCQFVACFFVHHAIGDGLSGMAFHRSFLAALVELEKRETSLDTVQDDGSCVIVPPEKVLIPNLEVLHPLPISISFLLSTLWNELVPRWSSRVWTGLNITTDAAYRKTRFRSFFVPAALTTGLTALARANETTLTGAIEAILSFTVFANLPAEFNVLKVAGPISLRPILPDVDIDSIGTWTNSYVQEHYRPEISSLDGSTVYLWNEARNVRSTIKAELAKKGTNIRTGLLKFTGDTHKFFEKSIGGARGASIELSNLGVFQPPEMADAPEWKVDRVLFSQAGNVIGSPLQVMLATGGDGCLNVGFSWLEGIVESRWSEKVMSDFKENIEHMAQS